MLEITGNDIVDLNDGDLRSLVARLAVAELRKKGHPLSAVTAGGNQDAADGGLDVRVECPSEISDPDFVPRRLTGFQVKKSDMPTNAIRNEMRLKGVLRDVIRELADASGAYVIVSSQGSVADKPLAERRKAMRDALNDVASAAQLYTDFYDRERLATWINEYPGIAAWVRGRVGRPLSGWSGIEDWIGSGNHDQGPYLSDDKACVIDERSREREHVSVREGIARLRAGLRVPKQCIRLVGLSGLGKTRLVQALFEDGVGESALDSSLAIYTDYSEETNPTARDMARDLIARGQRAIVIVDNCNPATHADLARLCSSEASEVSLITVEYDVRDDEPEHTDVFRLQAPSPELVTEWIKQRFPDISYVDRERIAAFSDGNFRVAAALAGTLGKGESVGSLKSRELFERIFRQRNPLDKQLLQAAEDLALLYSIDGEDVSQESELARVAAIRGIGAERLYEALNEMRQRGVVQARGRFRAILPQAIANPLAAHALERVPPSRFDQFCGSLPPRMLKSISRRLGYLHDSPAAQATVVRWLQSDGPLGDLIAMGEQGFQIIINVAPVAPEAVLARLSHAMDGPDGTLILEPTARGRHQWIRLLKAIGYDARLFDSAVTLLARFVAAHEGHTNDSALNSFREFFHLYLSGTQAQPEQRRAAIKRLAASYDDGSRRCASAALEALLETGPFVFSANDDFGARPRDWGWQPGIQKDICDWFEEAIALVVELAPESKARVLLARSLRGLWRYPGCRDALDRTVAFFLKTRPWIEGWIACRATLRYDGKKMQDDVRTRLEQLVRRLKPADLLNQARAVVLNRMPGGGGWDFADGEDEEGDASKAWKKADEMAVDVGRALAQDSSVRSEFLAELLAEPQPRRAFQCGCGLAEASDSLNLMWLELTTAYGGAASGIRNGTVLGGFVHAAHLRDPRFAAGALDAAVNDPGLLPILPYLQARVGLDFAGIARLRRAVAGGSVDASCFYSIANSSVANSPMESLAELLNDLSQLPGGVEIALDILHMHYFSRGREAVDQPNEELVSVGRDLLARTDFKKDSPVRDYGAAELIRICLASEDGRGAAEKLCAHICSALASCDGSSHNLTHILKALVETQPIVALDAFLLFTTTHANALLFDANLDSQFPLDSLDPRILQEWASREPDTRYPLLGKYLRLFASENGNEEKDLSPVFISTLDQAPNKWRFLGRFWDRLHPGGWSGSLADVLIRRKALVMKLANHSDDQVRAWIVGGIAELDRWIEQDRERDRAREESFE